MKTDTRAFVLREIENITGSPVTADDGTALGYGGLELESLQLLTLVVRAENHFGFKMGDETASVFNHTLGAFVSEIESRIPQR